MAMEAILVSVSTFVAKQLMDAAWKKILEARQKKKQEMINGQLKTKSPRIDGTAQPWLAKGHYLEAFTGDQVPLKIEFEPARIVGHIQLPIKNLNTSPEVSSKDSVLQIGVPYQSEVNLETGDNFVTKDMGYVKLDFGVPISVKAKEVEYNSSGILIPVSFKEPAKNPRVVNVSPPKKIPGDSQEVEVPFGRKVDAEIPVL
ncbi:MAG TPA: hypothetical protein VKK79_04950 [Candidatus Lokiarchaeia archaeon]|nr:hypothetical protein [Candidatus Lokiarchaeia archaeon]